MTYNKIARCNLRTDCTANPGGKLTQPLRAIVQPYLLGGTNVYVHLMYTIPWAQPTCHSKWDLDRVSRFSTVHARYQRTDGRTGRLSDGMTTELNM